MSEPQKKKTRRSVAAELGAALVAAQTVRDYWRELFLGISLAASPGGGAAAKTAKLAEAHARAAAAEIAQRCKVKVQAHIAGILEGWVSAHFTLAAAARSPNAAAAVVAEAEALYAEARKVAAGLAHAGSWEGRAGFEKRLHAAAAGFIELLAAKVAKDKAREKQVGPAASVAWAAVGDYATEWVVGDN